MSEEKELRAQRLRAAARRKHEAARQRAQNGLDEVIAAHQPVTFRAVARAGNVSLDFLYRDAGLRARIEALRAVERKPEPEASPSRSTVVHALTRQLRELRAENQDLRRRLEAAHGEIVGLKRTVGGRTASAVDGEDEIARRG